MRKVFFFLCYVCTVAGRNLLLSLPYSLRSYVNIAVYFYFFLNQECLFSLTYCLRFVFFFLERNFSPCFFVLLQKLLKHKRSPCLQKKKKKLMISEVPFVLLSPVESSLNKPSNNDHPRVIVWGCLSP